MALGAWGTGSARFDGTKNPASHKGQTGFYPKDWGG